MPLRKRSLRDFELYSIIDTGLIVGRDLKETAEAVISGGAMVIQLRAKDLASREMLRRALALREVTSGRGAALVINDRLDIALACGADGLHLGQDDITAEAARPLMKDGLVGISTHSLQQATDAQKMGADYISVGPIFSTGLKPNYSPVGPGLIREVKEKVTLPLIAIGGINMDNVCEVMRAGCDGIAVCSAILESDNIEKAARELLRKIKIIKSERRAANYEKRK